MWDQPCCHWPLQLCLPLDRICCKKSRIESDEHLIHLQAPSVSKEQGIIAYCYPGLHRSAIMVHMCATEGLTTAQSIALHPKSFMSLVRVVCNNIHSYNPARSTWRICCCHWAGLVAAQRTVWSLPCWVGGPLWAGAVQAGRGGWGMLSVAIHCR